MIKWKLMVTTLPIVGFVLAAKLGVQYGLGVDGFMEFSDVAVVLAGGIFLIGFMLNGTMADYKEAERLPAETACQLEALEETMIYAAKVKNLDMVPMRKALLALTDAIHQWLLKKKTQKETFQALHEMMPIFCGPEGPHAIRVLQEGSALRKVLTRIAVISRTGFMPTGYALLEGLLTVTFAILVVARYKSQVALVTIIFFTTLIYSYMYRLIRDIDDPFEYDESGVKGSADVELFPLIEYRERLAERVQSAGAGEAKAA